MRRLCRHFSRRRGSQRVASRLAGNVGPPRAALHRPGRARIASLLRRLKQVWCQGLRTVLSTSRSCSIRGPKRLTVRLRPTAHCRAASAASIRRGRGRTVARPRLGPRGRCLRPVCGIWGRQLYLCTSLKRSISSSRSSLDGSNPQDVVNFSGLW